MGNTKDDEGFYVTKIIEVKKWHQSKEISPIYMPTMCGPNIHQISKAKCACEERKPDNSPLDRLSINYKVKDLLQGFNKSEPQ